MRTENYISFHNFRGVTDFPRFDFNDVTILVGTNNSGKSTIIKALLLIRENIDYWRRVSVSIENAKHPTFKFNTSKCSVGNFLRAFYNKAKDNYLEFSIMDNGNIIQIRINKNLVDNPDSIEAPVASIKLTTSGQVDYLMDFEKQQITYIYHYIPGDDSEQSYWDIYQHKYHTIYPKIKEKQRCKLIQTSEVTVSMGNKIEYNDNMLDLRTTFGLLDRSFEKEIKAKILSGEEWVFEKVQHPYRGWGNALTILTCKNYIYAYEHASCKSSVYTKNDNDFVSDCIIEYAQTDMSNHSTATDFLHKWLAYFEIGSYCKAQCVEGDSYTLHIIDKYGKETPLADFGTGIIQLTALLLKLTVIIAKQQETTLILEEPEQNLHPALQAKLADLLWDITTSTWQQETCVQLIIETHSEYLVRKTQVLVHNAAQEENFHNPFKVLYCQRDRAPYVMKYLPDGRFENKFGPGFYDESTNLLFEIL